VVFSAFIPRTCPRHLPPPIRRLPIILSNPPRPPPHLVAAAAAAAAAAATATDEKMVGPGLYTEIGKKTRGGCQPFPSACPLSS
jgi:hypothetical protein